MIYIDSCVFNNIKLDNIDLVDVVFWNYGLSNQYFDNKLLSRVMFDNCKLLWIFFVSSSFKDIEFNSCNVRLMVVILVMMCL